MTVASMFTTFVSPIAAAFVQPSVIIAAFVVSASAAGVYLQSLKSSKAKALGSLLQTAAGASYGMMSTMAAGSPAMTASGVVAMETAAVSHGVEVLKTMAAAQAIKLPDAASLPATVAGMVGLLKAVSPTDTATPVVAPVVMVPLVPVSPVPVHVIGDAVPA